MKEGSEKIGDLREPARTNLLDGCSNQTQEPCVTTNQRDAFRPLSKSEEIGMDSTLDLIGPCKKESIAIRLGVAHKVDFKDRKGPHDSSKKHF